MEQRLCEWPAGTDGAPRAITRLEGQIEEQVHTIISNTAVSGLALRFTKKYKL